MRAITYEDLWAVATNKDARIRLLYLAAKVHDARGEYADACNCKAMAKQLRQPPAAKGGE